MIENIAGYDICTKADFYYNLVGGSEQFVSFGYLGGGVYAYYNGERHEECITGYVRDEDVSVPGSKYFKGRYNYRLPNGASGSSTYNVHVSNYNSGNIYPAVY